MFTVTSNIVVKTAYRYDFHPTGYTEEEKYSLKRIQEESAIFNILADVKNWHPNIVLSFLHMPDHVFMERACEDLFDHVTKNFRMGVFVIYCILREIINVVSWLEQISILHDDVRPPKILIDRDGHVKLCDFDNVYMIGQHIHVGNTLYYEQSEPGSFGFAGPESEQGAIDCCTYFISTGTEPQNRYHGTSQILVFGSIIRKSWDGLY